MATTQPQNLFKQQEDADYIASIGVVDVVETLMNEILSVRPKSKEAAVEVMTNVLLKMGGGGGGGSSKRSSPKLSDATVPRHLDVSVAMPSSNEAPAASNQMFSPTHFQHNLFSPFVQEGTVEPASTVKLPQALGNDIYRPEQAPLLIPTAGALHEFPHIVEEMAKINTPEGEQFTEEDFSKLDCMFVVPTAKGMIELKPNGANTRVTLATKDEFVALARKQLGVSPSTSKAAPRFDLKVQLTPPHTHNAGPSDPIPGLFSPTHFKHNIFSPFVSSETVPEANEGINNLALPPAMHATAGTSYNPTIVPLIKPTPGNVQQFPHILEELSLINTPEGMQFTEDEFRRMDVFFVVPNKSGEGVTELMKDGQSIRVTLATKDEYVRLAQKYFPITSGVKTQRKERYNLKCSPSASPRGGGDEKFGLFSPKHFQGEQQQQLQINIANQTQANRRLSSDVSSPLSPHTLNEKFLPMIAHIESINGPGGDRYDEQQFKELQITWCVPKDGKIVELVPGGKSKPVTLSDKAQYCAKARELLTEGATSKKKGFQVQPLTHVEQQSPQATKEPGEFFSPTHFQHNLFSPFVQEGTVEPASTVKLPKALGNDTYRPEQAPLLIPTAGALHEFPHIVEEMAKIN
eukprot:PhF_6_TR40225/c0_g1_i5/m.59788